MTAVYFKSLTQGTFIYLAFGNMSESSEFRLKNSLKLVSFLPIIVIKKKTKLQEKGERLKEWNAKNRIKKTPLFSEISIKYKTTKNS